MKLIKIAGITLLVVIPVACLFAYNNLRDHHRGYSIDLPANASPRSKIEQARNSVLKRIISRIPAGQLNQLTQPQLLSIIDEEEKAIFANDHWRFTVDNPALVSVMRHEGQVAVPFWLIEKGFWKSGTTVSNANYTYEVWQKEFPAGEIRLGINGFDLHRVVYFVTIGPLPGKPAPKILHHSPDNWPVIPMRKGAYTYNDWDELVIEQLPGELEGHMLFTTIRGRARDAAILNSFRETDYPALPMADQIMLTWSDDPRTTQAVQWRTDTSVAGMSLRYWPKHNSKGKFSERTATDEILSDPYIHNNPEVKHWEVNITRLQPDTEYNYLIYNSENNDTLRFISKRFDGTITDQFLMKK